MLGGEAKEQVHQAPAERRVTSIAVREASKAREEGNEKAGFVSCISKQLDLIS